MMEIRRVIVKGQLPFDVVADSDEDAIQRAVESGVLGEVERVEDLSGVPAFV